MSETEIIGTFMQVIKLLLQNRVTDSDIDRLCVDDDLTQTLKDKAALATSIAQCVSLDGKDMDVAKAQTVLRQHIDDLRSGTI
jgi:hypothetical protein